MGQSTPYAGSTGSTNSPLAGGELVGSMLIGLIRSLKNVHVLSGDIAQRLAEGVESSAWYPITHFFDVLNEIKHRDIDLKPILFHAGMAVAEDWYRNGGGNARIFSTADLLRMQADNVGYSQIHRGDPEVIGRVDLAELDEAAGRAVLVCLTPYPKEFERGLFYGSVTMLGDMQYVQVSSDERPYKRHLTRKIVTFRFHRQPEAALRHELDALLAEMTPGRKVDIPEHLHDAIAWRLQSVEANYRIERAFHQQSSRLLSLAANEIYDLSSQLGALAYHDDLTGLLNRRAVLERAKTLLALSARQGSSISLLMIDIDHFKRINDKHGHAAGDRMLRLIGDTLRDNLRDSDLLGRIGGEEFLAVLPDTGADGAATLAECLRARVARQVGGFDDDSEEVATISLGVATFTGRPGGSLQLGECLKLADEALYRSKRDGRNRATCIERAAL